MPLNFYFNFKINFVPNFSFKYETILLVHIIFLQTLTNKIGIYLKEKLGENLFIR